MTWLWIALALLGLLLLVLAPRLLVARHIAKRHGFPVYPFDRVFDQHRSLHEPGTRFGHTDTKDEQVADLAFREGRAAMEKMLGKEAVDKLFAEVPPDAVRHQLLRSVQEGRIQAIPEEVVRGEELASFLRQNAPELVGRMAPEDLVTSTSISKAIARLDDAVETVWDWWHVFVNQRDQESPHEVGRLAGEGGALKDPQTLRWVARALVEHGEEGRRRRVTWALERGEDRPVPPWAPPDDLVDQMIEEMAQAREACSDPTCPCHLTSEAEKRPLVAKSLAEGHGLPAVVHFLECGHVETLPSATKNAISLYCSTCHRNEMVRHEFRVGDTANLPGCSKHRDE